MKLSFHLRISYPGMPHGGHVQRNGEVEVSGRDEIIKALKDAMLIPMCTAAEETWRKMKPRHFEVELVRNRREVRTAVVSAFSEEQANAELDGIYRRLDDDSEQWALDPGAKQQGFPKVLRELDPGTCGEPAIDLTKEDRQDVSD